MIPVWPWRFKGLGDTDQQVGHLWPACNSKANSKAVVNLP